MPTCLHASQGAVEVPDDAIAMPEGVQCIHRNELRAIQLHSCGLPRVLCVWRCAGSRKS